MSEHEDLDAVERYWNKAYHDRQGEVMDLCRELREAREQLEFFDTEQKRMGDIICSYDEKLHEARARIEEQKLRIEGLEWSLKELTEKPSA